MTFTPKQLADEAMKLTMHDLLTFEAILAALIEAQFANFDQDRKADREADHV